MECQDSGNTEAGKRWKLLAQCWKVSPVWRESDGENNLGVDCTSYTEDSLKWEISRNNSEEERVGRQYWMEVFISISGWIRGVFSPCPLLSRGSGEQNRI